MASVMIIRGKLRRLDLNLISQPRWSPWSLSLFVVGVLSLSISLFVYRDLLVQVALQRDAVPNNPKYQARFDSEIDLEQRNQAKLILSQLNTPWGQIFESLEKSVTHEVRVLQVSPVVTERRVSLVGLAPDVYVMLEFSYRLSEQPVFYDVVVRGYEMNPKDQNFPVKFSFDLHWKDGL